MLHTALLTWDPRWKIDSGISARQLQVLETFDGAFSSSMKRDRHRRQPHRGREAVVVLSNSLSSKHCHALSENMQHPQRRRACRWTWRDDSAPCSTFPTSSLFNRGVGEAELHETRAEAEKLKVVVMPEDYRPSGERA